MRPYYFIPKPHEAMPHLWDYTSKAPPPHDSRDAALIVLERLYQYLEWDFRYVAMDFGRLHAGEFSWHYASLPADIQKNIIKAALIYRENPRMYDIPHPTAWEKFWYDSPCGKGLSHAGYARTIRRSAHAKDDFSLFCIGDNGIGEKNPPVPCTADALRPDSAAAVFYCFDRFSKVPIERDWGGVLNAVMQFFKQDEKRISTMLKGVEETLPHFKSAPAEQQKLWKAFWEQFGETHVYSEKLSVDDGCLAHRTAPRLFY